MKNKGVSEIIAVIMILVMSAGLLGTALSWGLTMINKRQDSTNVERLYNHFDYDNQDSIGNEIEFVAKNGGQETFSSNIKGLWTLTCTEADDGDECGDSLDILEFVTNNKVSNIAVSTDENNIGWIALTPGGSCPPISGTVGINNPYVVCAKSEPFGEGYNMTYRIWLRELYDSSESKIWKINLVKHESGDISKDSNSIKIIRGDVTTGNQDGKTLITTEVKILLI